jgi:hypothetical protein
MLDLLSKECKWLDSITPHGTVSVQLLEETAINLDY